MKRTLIIILLIFLCLGCASNKPSSLKEVHKSSYSGGYTKIDGISNGFEYVVSEDKIGCFIVGYRGKSKQPPPKVVALVGGL
jgi:hypothetical protein